MVPEIEPYSDFGPRTLRPAPTVTTFSLLKLHGSLSWFWVPTDQTGSTLAAWSVDKIGSALRNDRARRRDLPGRDPYLVPPTTSKASFFETMVTRELWRRAHEALAVAKRVVLVGYSLPAADGTFLGLLADTIVGRDVEVVVVNPHADPVKAQLAQLGVEGDIQSVDDVEIWVAQEIRRDAKLLVEHLRSLGLEDPNGGATTTMSVGWWGDYAPTRDVYPPHERKGSDELVLGTHYSDEEGGSEPAKLADIIPRLEGIMRISADVGGRNVTMTQRVPPTPAYTVGTDWRLHLFPVGRPRSH